MGVGKRLLAIWQGLSWSRRLLALHALVFVGAELCGFVLDLLAPLHWWQLLGWMSFYPQLDKLLSAPWTLVSYIFPHQHLLHLLLNLLLLYYLLPRVEHFFGRRRLLALYLGGALGGSLTYLLGYYLLAALGVHLLPLPLQGCSSAILAGLTALLVQTQTWRTLRAKPMRWLLFGGLLLVVALGAFSANIGGTLAHLGGITLGLVYGLRFRQGKDDLAPCLGLTPDPSPADRMADEALRKKLRLSGYASLSEEERARLRQISDTSPR